MSAGVPAAAAHRHASLLFSHSVSTLHVLRWLPVRLVRGFLRRICQNRWRVNGAWTLLTRVRLRWNNSSGLLQRLLLTYSPKSCAPADHADAPCRTSPSPSLVSCSRAHAEQTVATLPLDPALNVPQRPGAITQPSLCSAEALPVLVQRQQQLQIPYVLNQASTILISEHHPGGGQMSCNSGRPG